ncbi:antiterminator Q family protein [Escherichia coli]|nr:antiterminator Q family protein [Escherichia coli]MDW2516506.1 antiterminator Q family protein [Escherichia coli]
MRDIQMVLERWGAWAANNHDEPPRESWRLNSLIKR